MPPNRTRTSRQLSIAFAPPLAATAAGSLSKKGDVTQPSPEEARDRRAARLLDVLVVLEQEEGPLLDADPIREPDRLYRLRGGLLSQRKHRRRDVALSDGIHVVRCAHVH